MDVGGARDQSATTANPAGIGLTLTGSNDVIVQYVNYGTNATAISGTYTSPADFPGGSGVAGSINTSSGTAPTWTATSSTGALGALALKETGGAVKHCTLSLMHAGPC